MFNFVSVLILFKASIGAYMESNGGWEGSSKANTGEYFKPLSKFRQKLILDALTCAINSGLEEQILQIYALWV